MKTIVSVILPVYNQRPDYLELSIRSILLQTFRDFELIIVDDGSNKDDCLSILKKHARADSRIRLIRNKKNLGLVASLNLGVQEAKSPLIARMDSDDISLPNRLERQFSFLNSHPQYDLIGSWAEVIDESDYPIGTIKFPTDPSDISSSIIRGNIVIHPTWMFRKSLFEQIGGYDAASINTEDYDFLLKAAKKHTIGNIPEILLQYRFNTHGISFKKNKIQEWYSLKARWRAITKYGYPPQNIIYLIRPLLILLFIPSAIKFTVLKHTFKKP